MRPRPWLLIALSVAPLASAFDGPSASREDADLRLLLQESAASGLPRTSFVHAGTGRVGDCFDAALPLEDLRFCATVYGH